MGMEHVFPLRVVISYNFGLVGKDFSRRSFKSDEAPTIFISTDDFNYTYNSDGPEVLSRGLRIEFREEEKDSIKKYFDYLVENSWDKMESFFGSHGIKLPEKDVVSESLSKSFIEYLKGVTSFLNEIFTKYSEIAHGEKYTPLLLEDILNLASEASNLCLYSINIRDPDDPYVYLSFSDIEENLDIYEEEENPLKKLERINLTKKDLENLEKEKLKKTREALERLAEAIFYRDGFQYLDIQSIDKLIHIALSLGGRFYSLFPKVNSIKGTRDEDEFLVTTNIVYRTFSLQGEEVPFPAILVSIEASAKGENRKEVRLTYESENEGKKEIREVGPIRAGFGFLIDLSNTILEIRYDSSLFFEDEIIEKIEFYPNKEEEYVIVEEYDSYLVYLKTKVNFKSGAMWCPVSLSYLRLEEVLDREDEVSVFVPKVFLTSLVSDSPESEDLDLDEFIDIYKPLLGKGEPEIELILENLLPQDSLVISIVSSYLGFLELEDYRDIRPPFHFYNGEKYEKDYLMDSLIRHELVPVAVSKPEEKVKGKDHKEKSDKSLSISDLELHKYFIYNSVIVEKIMYPFFISVVAEKYLSGKRSDLCFRYDEENKIRIFPRSWEEKEDEIRRHLPFKKLGEVGTWEYKSENSTTHLEDGTLYFPGSIGAYFAEKTKLAVEYEEKVKEKSRKGLFYVLSWATLADLKEIKEEIGDIEQIRKKMFRE
jgi:hypothetical protein